MHNCIRLAIAVLVVATAPFASAQVPPPAPPDGSHVLNLPDGGRLMASYTKWPDADGDGYAFAVWKYKADGALDSSLNRRGFAAIPIWGQSEGVEAIAVQPDGKILLLGIALDPMDADIRRKQCSPYICGSYAALVRLDRDGALDFSFNKGGKVVLDYPSNDAFLRMRLLEDGTIEISDEGTVITRVTPAGAILPVPEAPYPVRAFPYFHAQGLWTSSDAASGAQLALSQQGDIIFVTRIGAEVGGTRQWEVGAADRMERTVWDGQLFRASGPPLSQWPLVSTLVQVAPTTSIALRFSDSDHVVAKRVAADGTVITESFVRSPGPAYGCSYGFGNFSLTPNLTDVWYTPTEAGWGIHLQQVDSGSLHLTWFAYDDARNPVVLQGELTNYYGDYQGEIPTGGTKLQVFIEPTETGELLFDYSPLAFPGTGREIRLQRMVYRAPGSTCR